MSFLYETHLHTCQGSACGTSTGKEHARYYKEIGYQGIIVTDHFFGGNTAVPRDLPWKERAEWFCSGYEDALAEGQKIGLDVFFGWEQNFNGDEYLVYGLDKAWLLAHPEMEHWNRRQQLEGVHAAGGCVVQAHPFRMRSYMTHIGLGLRFCDGIEAANGGNDTISAVTAMGYDAYYVALEAIKQAGSADKAAIMAALPGVTYTGVSGAIAFDEVGDAVRDTAYIKTADTAAGTWVLETVQTGSAS